MTHDVQRFRELTEALLQERAEVIAQLQAMDDALGLGLEIHHGRPQREQSRAQKRLALNLRAGHINDERLEDAIRAVLKWRPLTRREILKAVLRRGYRFLADKPLLSIGQALYGKKSKLRAQLVNSSGRFSLRDSSENK